MKNGNFVFQLTKHYDRYCNDNYSALLWQKEASLIFIKYEFYISLESGKQDASVELGFTCIFSAMSLLWQWQKEACLGFAMKNNCKWKQVTDQCDFS